MYNDKQRRLRRLLYKLPLVVVIIVNYISVSKPTQNQTQNQTQNSIKW